LNRPSIFMFSSLSLRGAVYEVANELALLVVFLLGWFVFKYAPLRRLSGRDAAVEKAFEKEMAADLASGQPKLVVERARNLSHPTEETLRLVTSALLEVDPLAIPSFCGTMLSKNGRLSLDVVVSVVITAPSQVLSAVQLDTLADALRGIGAVFSDAALCRALAERDVPNLASRFGDLADRVRFERLLEAETVQPAALLAAFQAAPDLGSFRAVVDALARGGHAELRDLVGMDMVQDLAADKVLDILKQVPFGIALSLLQTWRCAHGGTAAMYAHLVKFDAELVAKLAAEDGVQLPVDAARVRSVMNSLRKCSCAATAVSLADSVIPCPLVVTNMALQVCVAHDLLKARIFFWKLVARDVVTFNTILKGEAQAGCWEEVRVLLSQMASANVAANHVTFNTLLHACVAQKASPWSFVAAMEKHGLQPDAITVTTLLRTVSGPTDVANLRRCLAFMGSVATADADMFDMLFDACARARSRDHLITALQAASRAGVKTARGTIALLRIADTAAEAWSVWEQLDASSATEAEYAQMITSLTGHGALVEARELCATARVNGRTLVPVAAVALIKALCQHKDADNASLVFEDLLACLRASGGVLQLTLFNALLDAWSRVGDMARAEELWGLAGELGVEPDLISFSSLVKGYCVTGDLERALAIFGQLRRRGLRPDAILFHSILDGCANRQMEELAEQIYNDMIRDGHKPTNITLSILVKLYGRTSLERAREAFDDLPARFGFAPNAQVFTCLMSVALTHRNVTAALRVKEDMKEAGCRPDAKTFQTLQKGCMRLQYLDEAVAVAEEALAAGCIVERSLLMDLQFVVERRNPDLAQRLRSKLGQDTVRQASKPSRERYPRRS
jgi:pentatricopeptide repeat protein